VVRVLVLLILVDVGGLVQARAVDAADLFTPGPGGRTVMHGCDIGADTGWRVTSGKVVGVAADSGDNLGALAASGGVVGLILWSSTMLCY